MTEKLIEILSAFGYPVRLQGSLAKDEAYPDSFFTFWNNSSDDGSHYDNGPIFYVWNFDVNFYSTDPALVYTQLEAARVALKAAGFIISGRGYTVASDEPTHTGRGLTALIIENKSNDEDNPDDGEDSGNEQDPGSEEDPVIENQNEEE